VLLIIFMITTPLLENSMDLVVPTSDTANTAIDPSKVQIIEIDREGVIKFNDTPVSVEVLEADLRALREASEAAAVVIRPHEALDIQRFIYVMDAVRRAGITKAGVATRAESPNN
jgi:biopolymer transport protein ExbD